MFGIGTRIVAAALLGVTALFVGIGDSLSSADEPQPPKVLDPTQFDRVGEVHSLPFAGGIFDTAEFGKVQDRMRRAMEALVKDPNDADSRKQLAEVWGMMMRAMTGGTEWASRPGVLTASRAPGRARLGLHIAPLTPLLADQLGLESGRGVAVAGIVEGSAAEKAGFKVHDIVVEFSGKPVTDPADFVRRVAAVKAGERPDAVVVRKGKRVELKGIDLPDPQPEVVPMKPETAETGRVVDSVSVSVSNGAFTAKAMRDGVSYLITGKAGPDGTSVEKIDVRSGEETIEAQEIGKVPEKYRPVIEELLKLVGKPHAKFIH